MHGHRDFQGLADGSPRWRMVLHITPENPMGALSWRFYRADERYGKRGVAGHNGSRWHLKDCWFTTLWHGFSYHGSSSKRTPSLQWEAVWLYHDGYGHLLLPLHWRQLHPHGLFQRRPPDCCPLGAGNHRGQLVLTIWGRGSGWGRGRRSCGSLPLGLEWEGHPALWSSQEAMAPGDHYAVPHKVYVSLQWSTTSWSTASCRKRRKEAVCRKWKRVAVKASPYWAAVRTIPPISRCSSRPLPLHSGLFSSLGGCHQL